MLVTMIKLKLMEQLIIQEDNLLHVWVTVSDGSNFTGTLNELILENTTNANVVRASSQ